MKKMLLVAFTLVLASCGTPSEPATEVEEVVVEEQVDSTVVEEVVEEVVETGSTVELEK